MIFFCLFHPNDNFKKMKNVPTAILNVYIEKNVNINFPPKVLRFFFRSRLFSRIRFSNAQMKLMRVKKAKEVFQKNVKIDKARRIPQKFKEIVKCNADNVHLVFV